MLGLSTLGLFHTVISIIAVVIAIFHLLSIGKINPHILSGRLYLITTAIGCITAFGLSKQGGFNPGHALAILTLGCLIFGMYVEKLKFKNWSYFQVGLLSLSLFFSLIPAIGETLIRLPLGSPFAANLQAPLVQQSVGILFILLIGLLFFQYKALKRIMR